MEAAGYKLPADARQLPPAVGWAAAPAQDAAWEDSSLDSRLSTCAPLPAPAEASPPLPSFLPRPARSHSSCAAVPAVAQLPLDAFR